MNKSMLWLAVLLLIGGTAGWWGYVSNRPHELTPSSVNQEMENLLKQSSELSVRRQSENAGRPEQSAPQAVQRQDERQPGMKQPQAAPDSPVSSAIPPNDSTVLDLNTATLEQLLTLPGIGESKGKAILELRSRLGGFQALEQLKDVKGIGEKLFEKLRQRVRIGSP